MEAEFVIINVYYQGIDQFFALIDETQVMKFTEFIFLIFVVESDFKYCSKQQ